MRLDRARLLSVAGLVIGLGYAAFNVPPYDTTLFWTAGHRAEYTGRRGARLRLALRVSAAARAGARRVPWVPYLIVWTALLGVAFWAATRSWSLIVLAISTAALIVFDSDHLLANPVALTLIGNPQIMLRSDRHPRRFGTRRSGRSRC